MGISVGEMLCNDEELNRRMLESYMNNARFCVPGIIQTFDSKKQTATVQPAIKERLNGKWERLPLLLDVPVFFPRGGGYCLTFPVKSDDECLLVFSDMCLDAWWQSGGVQTQLEMRRHDLSDACALMGITSVPRAVTDYSANSVMLRNEDKDSYLEIVDDDKTINIIGAEKIKIAAADDINIVTDASLSVEAAKDITVHAAQSIKITADATLHIHSKQAMTITSDHSICMDAPQIYINEDR